MNQIPHFTLINVKFFEVVVTSSFDFHMKFFEDFVTSWDQTIFHCPARWVYDKKCGDTVVKNLIEWKVSWKSEWDQFVQWVEK